MRNKLAIIVGLLVIVTLIGAAVALVGLPNMQPGPLPVSTAAPTSNTPLTATAPTAGTVPGGAPAGNGSLQLQPGDTTIRLNWPTVAGASGYLVYRDGASDPLDAAPTTATSYLDIGLTNSRTYTYTVAALDPQGQPARRLGPVAAAPHSK